MCPMATAAEHVALRFNDAINQRDLERLVDLMTDDHLFVDAAGGTTRGKEAMRAAWKSFFEAFPDYQNAFARSHACGETILFWGQSECAEPDLSGAAIWRAVVRGHQVAEWHVYEDTPQTRSDIARIVPESEPP